MGPLRALFVVPLVAAPWLLLAQESASLKPEERAVMTARRIAAAIDIDDRAIDKATGLMVEGEHEVAELRERMEEIQREIDARLNPYFEQFAVTLEPDQAARLEALIASGALRGCCLEGTVRPAATEVPQGSSAGPPTAVPAGPAGKPKTTGGAK